MITAAGDEEQGGQQNPDDYPSSFSLMQREISIRVEQHEPLLQTNDEELQEDSAESPHSGVNINETNSHHAEDQTKNELHDPRPGIQELKKALEYAKAELKAYTDEMKQELDNHHQEKRTIPQQDEKGPSTSRSASSTALFRNLADSHDGLPHDTFTLMMTSPPCNKAWVLGLFTFTFQMVLLLMIGADQLQESINSSAFNVPFKIDPVVRTGQIFAIIFALATQNDVISSIRFLVMFWKGAHWDGGEGVPLAPTAEQWFTRILLPNLLKFTQGMLVICATFVVIVQSDNIIELLKEFTALMVLSEIDNIFFGLATNGYLGPTLLKKTIEAKRVKIQCEMPTAGSQTNSNPSASSPSTSSDYDKDYALRSTILLLVTMAMIGGWLYIVLKQINGMFFLQRYPDCNATNAFELATKHFGDGVCYGGPLNTLGCEFEDGDCVNFNLAFPLCKGDNLTDIQSRVGNGDCEPIFMNEECDYDGGDCCPYQIINDPSFGDGLCNGGIQSSERCGYDSGDCHLFRISYPNCPLNDLSQNEGTNSTILGDGFCDSGIYNTEECGLEYGDCNEGQVGQTMLITDGIVSNYGEILFTQVFSLDGTTMAMRLSRSRKDKRSQDDGVPGFVRVWRYNEARKIWWQLGNDIELVGSGGDNFDSVCGLTLDSSGSRIAIASRSGMRVYDYITASGDKWTQLGTTLVSDISGARGTMSANGARLALVHSRNETKIYNLDLSSGKGQIWVNKVHDSINLGTDDLSSNTHLKFDPVDGSSLLMDIPRNDRDKSTKIFRLDKSTTPPVWKQIGQDIESQNVHHTSSVIGVREEEVFVAIPFNSTTIDAPGEVIVYEYHPSQNDWKQVGSSLKSVTSRNGDGFGFTIDMSSDGNLLVIGSNSPLCRISNRLFAFASNTNDIDVSGTVDIFDTNECTNTGSIEVFNYNSERFQKVVPNSSSSFLGANANANVLNLADFVSDDNIIFGLHSSISEDGTLLSISGFDTDNKDAIVQVYNLGEFFYTKCIVDEPYLIKNGVCNDRPPYNSDICGFDGGDCRLKPVRGLPKCSVLNPNWVGDERCTDYPPYNTNDCEFDGGDCVKKPVSGYPDCVILPEYHNRIGNGFCDELDPNLNSNECGFDGGDCGDESTGTELVSWTLPPTTTEETIHGICVINAAFATATSTQDDLFYTNVEPFVDGTKAWGNRDYVLEGVENSPCQNGIYLRPSLHRYVDQGTSITVTAPIISTICVFVDSYGHDYGDKDGGWPESLLLNGFTSYGEPDGFTRSVPAFLGGPSQLTIFCSHGDWKTVPAPFATIDFSSPDVLASRNGLTLHGGAQVLQDAPDGVPRALRTSASLEYAKWDVDINPTESCTLVICVYVVSLDAGKGHILGHENGHWERTIFINEDNFNGMGIWAGGENDVNENVNYPHKRNPDLGKWSHIVGVFDQNGDHTFYYDNERAPINFKSSSGEGKKYLMIGGHEEVENRHSNTWIKEVRVYDKALDDGQVAALYSDFQAYLEEVKIPERANFNLVYALDIPHKSSYKNHRPAYFVNRHKDLPHPNFNRVAYYLQLDDNYVWVSMDTFTPDANKIGVPCLSLECGNGITRTVIQQVVTNVNIISNVPGLSGTGLSGNIEFWPYNYGEINKLNITGGSDDTFDLGDYPKGNGDLGSMQIHINGGGSYVGTVFAFNNFNRDDTASLGIGSQPFGHPDWTYADNANIFSFRNLKIYISNGTGILASYFEYSSSTLPTGGLLDNGYTPYKSETVDTINFATTEDNFAGSGRSDYVAASFEGYLYFEEAGTYTLCLTSDDGSKLYMGEALLIDNDGIHSDREVCKSFKISTGGTAGRIIVDYFERTGDATLRLSWTTPSNAGKVIVPSSAWAYEESTSPQVDN